MRLCPVCCRGFEPGPKGQRQVHCSTRCTMWWTKFDMRARVARMRWNQRCEVCSTQIHDPAKWGWGDLRGYGGKRFCGKACKEYALGNQRTSADRCDLRWESCGDCGGWVSVPPRAAGLLCRECSATHAAENRRRKNRRRHLAIQGNGGSPGAYTLADIIHRDGSSCHLCRHTVDSSLSGLHPMGPTIDHLIPVSAGGLDDPINVALAHRSCNVRRGARGEVQLRLIA